MRFDVLRARGGLLRRHIPTRLDLSEVNKRQNITSGPSQLPSPGTPGGKNGKPTLPPANGTAPTPPNDNKPPPPTPGGKKGKGPPPSNGTTLTPPNDGSTPPSTPGGKGGKKSKAPALAPVNGTDPAQVNENMPPPPSPPTPGKKGPPPPPSGNPPPPPSGALPAQLTGTPPPPKMSATQGIGPSPTNSMPMTPGKGPKPKPSMPPTASGQLPPTSAPTTLATSMIPSAAPDSLPTTAVGGIGVNPSPNSGAIIDSNGINSTFTQTKPEMDNKTTVAVSIVVIIIGGIALITGAVFLFRRVMRRNRPEKAQGADPTSPRSGAVTRFYETKTGGDFEPQTQYLPPLARSLSYPIEQQQNFGGSYAPAVVGVRDLDVRRKTMGAEIVGGYEEKMALTNMAYGEGELHRANIAPSEYPKNMTVAPVISSREG